MGVEEIKRGFQNILSNITVEPCLLFFSICQGLYIIVAQNLYIQKVCQVNLNISAEICESIYLHKTEQLEVQKYVAVLQGYNQILQAVPAVFFALFAGPWSDTHGRKWLLIASSFGYIFNNGVFIINTIWFHELPAEYLLFECLQDCTGGYVCFFLASYAYISDVSTKEQRTKRLAFLDGLFPAGFFFGMSLSGPIKEKIGFIGNFSLGLTFALLCMFYAIFFVKDSRQNRPQEVQEYLDMVEKMEGKKEKKGGLRAMFDIQNVKDGFKTVFRKRDNNLRSFIIMLTIAFLLEIMLTNGKGPITYLYFRRKFSWDMSQFGSYIGIYGFVSIFAQFVVVPFLSQKMKLHDTTIGMLAIVGCIIQSIMLCFTPSGSEYSWMIYVGSLFSFLSGSITTCTRSLTTKCVGPMEVGKVFSIMGALQAMVPLVAGPMYAFMYRETVETFPGMYLLFGAGLYLVVMELLTFVYVGMKRSGVLNRDTKDDFKPVHMEQLLQKKNEEEKVSKIILETAPEGDRFKEVAVFKERLN